MSITRKVTTKSEVLKRLKDKEENILRMKNGIVADLEMELELKAKNNPALQAKIAEIEKEIFDDIKDLINQYENTGADNPAKSKIIASLRKKCR
ncbi:MAG: hypothetical protein N3B13_05300 [Deltaproteobacteria bacterium]|nr:hypothetical protein [Deltaproteobacteria bacterium]